MASEPGNAPMSDAPTSEEKGRPLDGSAGDAVRTVVFTDLDDTLFRTARKTPPDELARARRAARANNGRDSFATPRQSALLDWLDPARCVPVTARGSEAFSRVLLPFAGPAAVLANGAVVLGADGTPDPIWQERIRCALGPVRDTLDALPERIRAEAARHGVAIRTWLVEEPGCGGVYAVAKAESDPAGGSLRALVPGLREALVDAGEGAEGNAGGNVDGEAGEGAWQVHLNGNNLGAAPAGAVQALGDGLPARAVPRGGRGARDRRRRQRERPAVHAPVRCVDHAERLADRRAVRPRPRARRYRRHRSARARADGRNGERDGGRDDGGTAAMTREGTSEAPDAAIASPSVDAATFSGSYLPADVTFLLRMVSPAQAAALDRHLATEPIEKEGLIQSGARHYSEMITPERAPAAAYQAIFERALARHAGRCGRDVAALARALDRHVDGPITLCSLVRAGVPPGVALARTLRALGRDVSHFGLSIVRDRGIDAVALEFVLARRPAAGVVFVDGWTGKGAISDELERSLASGWPALAPRLVVLADPAGRAWLAASDDDWLIPSGILGGTVSGLVSRSILNPRLVGAGDFHASVRLDHLAAHDVSRRFVDAVTAEARRALEASAPVSAVHPATRDPAARAGVRAVAAAVIDAVADEFGVTNRNRIKPGLAEATRAVLRRAPARILIGAPDDDDLDGLRHLARQANVPIERRGEALFPYRAITLIADASGR